MAVLSTARASLTKTVGTGVLIATALLYFKARFITPQKHSLLLALAHFGPLTMFRALFLSVTRIFSKIPHPKSAKTFLAEYRPRASDIIVAVPAKSGTTWLMQIAHQLRLGGREVDFDDQMDVMPWLEGGAAAVLNQDINMEQIGEPRVYKSHLGWKAFEEEPLQSSKIIYCFRDVKDVAISAWKFIPPIAHAEISCWAFTTAMCSVGMVDKSLHDLCSFWEHRHDERMCFFFFDDLKESHVECVQRVQKFMALGSDDELTQKVVSQSTHEYMSRPDRHTRFDDHKICHAIDAKRGITRTMPLTGKVRKDGGKSGSGKEGLPQSVKDWVDWRWKCIVLPQTGFADLQAMRRAWRTELAGKCAGALVS
jgi:hypothetical protein